MDRKLTLELLRLAVTQLLLGDYASKWKAAHWDRLEGYFESAVIAQKTKLRSDKDSDGRPIVAPDIKTAKDFLQVPEDKIRWIRDHKSDRIGIPSINTQDFLVRILGFPLDKLRDFEACMEALQLHPDQVRAQNIDLLARITDYFAATKGDSDMLGGAAHNETELDAAMEQDTVEKTQRGKETSSYPFDVDIPDGPEESARQVKEEDAANSTLMRARKLWKAVALLGVSLSLIAGMFFAARSVWGWPSSPPAIQPQPKPLIDMHTHGDNSPIIHNRDGDVTYIVDPATSKSGDTLADTLKQ